MAKVTAEYVRFKTDNATGVVGQDFNTKVATIGVIAPVGPGRIKLGLSASERDVDGIASDFNANKIALGYDYVLSKRTSLFVTVARVNNSGGSAVGVADGGVAGFGSPTRVNSRSVGYDVGILHSF